MAGEVVSPTASTALPAANATRINGRYDTTMVPFFSGKRTGLVVNRQRPER